MEKILTLLSINQNVVMILCLFICVVILFYIIKPNIKKRKSNMFMSGYKIFYTDQKEEKRSQAVIYSKILHSEKYDIQGKPDYIFKSVLGRNMVPVEIKSGNIGVRDMPYEGDLMQLTAYFIIIHEVYGIKPSYGKIVYKDYMFTVKNTSQIRNRLIKNLKTMRQMLDGKSVKITPEFIKCRHCVCNGTVCEFCYVSKKRRKYENRDTC